MWKSVNTLVGDAALDFSNAAIDPICEIAKDAEASAIFYPEEMPKGMTPMQWQEGRLRKAVPVLLKRHRDSVMEIVAANAGITVEEYREKATVMELSTDVAMMLFDPAMSLFFTFVQSKAPASASAPGITGGKKASGRSCGTAPLNVSGNGSGKRKQNIWRRLWQWLRKTRRSSARENI